MKSAVPIQTDSDLFNLQIPRLVTWHLILSLILDSLADLKID